MTNENNTDKIIDALDRMHKAEPSEIFLLKMEQLALKYTAVADKISVNALLGIAASFLLLLMVNMVILKKSTTITETSNTEITDSDTYHLIPTKSLYNE